MCNCSVMWKIFIVLNFYISFFLWCFEIHKMSGSISLIIIVLIMLLFSVHTWTFQHIKFILLFSKGYVSSYGFVICGWVGGLPTLGLIPRGGPVGPIL